LEPLRKPADYAVVNVFVEFASGTSSALALLVANTTTRDREREKQRRRSKT
jgi:hypothetical protein